MTAVHPTWQRTRPDDPSDTHTGWTFVSKPDDAFIPPSGFGSIVVSGAEPDPNEGFKYVRDIYDAVNDTNGET